jgi:hypothetical protein
MAIGRSERTWQILAAGRLVALRKQFTQTRKFRRGHIVALVCSEQEAKKFGGVYAVRPIDGPDTETLQQLPRSAFFPVETPKPRSQVSR